MNRKSVKNGCLIKLVICMKIEAKKGCLPATPNTNPYIPSILNLL